MNYKSIFLTILTFFSVAQATTSTYLLHQDILNGAQVPFLNFSGPGPFDTYVTMNLPYAPAYSLLEQVMEKENTVLKDRKEAHITVITPVEYMNVLRLKNVTIAEINAIAASMQIQKSKFEVVCLGRGDALVAGQIERTFYVVVKSDDLLAIRKKIQDLYISKGGQASEFVPTNYYPHITLGYTDRDLHESDGIIKGPNSCLDPIKIIK